MRESLSIGDYNYSPAKESAEVNGEQATDEKQEAWTSSENMVISLDPFNHNNYGNPEHTPQSDNPSEDTGMQSLPNVPEHIQVNYINSLIKIPFCVTM